MPKAVADRPDRRQDITQALFRCLKKQGYANTSLKDIAKTADMSPSHLGYYFENKAAILEDLAAAICRQNLAGLPEFTGSTPSPWIDRLADFCLGPGNISTAVLSVIQELAGLAAHDDRLRKIKTRHTTAWRKYLESGFSNWTLRAGLSNRQAAWHAHALIVGFNTNLLFDSQFSRINAHALLTQGLRAFLEPFESQQFYAKAAKR